MFESKSLLFFYCLTINFILKDDTYDDVIKLSSLLGIKSTVIEGNVFNHRHTLSIPSILFPEML